MPDREEAEKIRKGIEVLKEKSEQHGAKVCTISGKPPDPDYANLGGAPQPINPETGQHKDYYVLCPEERAKGFIRPVRRTYIHTGRLVCGKPATTLTEEWIKAHLPEGKILYVCNGSVGHDDECRSWTPVSEKELERLTAKGLLGGCGTSTSMSLAIAETFARDPKFYGAGMCVRCKTHFPNAEFRWEDGSVVGS